VPSIQQLRYLVAVADTLHFRRAAELCNVTQPTLSGQLQALESRLGVQLVERSRSRVILTPAGQEIVVRARVVLRDVQDIVDLARRGRGPLGGTLRLGILPTLGPYLMPHLVPELHRSYPDLRYFVREGMPGSLLHQLEDGNLDLLILAEPAASEDLEVAPLFLEPLLLATPSDHPLARREAIEPADLFEQTILALEPGHRLHDQVRALAELYGAKLALDYEGTSLDTLRQMVGMGMGLAFLPALYVRSEIPKDRDVAVRPFSPRSPERTIVMVWRRRSARSAEFSRFAAELRHLVRKSLPELEAFA